MKQELYSEYVKRIMSQINPDRLYDVQEVAKMLEKSRQSVLKRIKNDQLRASRMGGKWYILGKEILLVYFADYNEKMLK